MDAFSRSHSLRNFPPTFETLTRGVPWAMLAMSAGDTESGPAGLAFAAVWHDVPGLVSEEVHGLDPAAHRARCVALAQQGYRPAALTVAAMPASGGRQPPERALIAGSVWHRPTVPEAAKDALAKRQAQAAVALLALDAPERVWPLFEHRPDPRVRSFLIHRLEPLHADKVALLKRLGEERDVSRRRALLLALGSYPREEDFVPTLRRWFRDEPDAGLHGAAEWLLRRWGDAAEIAKVEKELASGVALAPRVPARVPARGWHVNGQGQTMVVVPAGQRFWMGSPGDEAGRTNVSEPLHRVHIERSYGIGAKEVTLGQFLRFDPTYRFTARFSAGPDGPAFGVTWFQAAEYCNWLSNKEGIPEAEWCYRPNRAGNFDDGMQFAPNYLSKKGYRLPTEAEWEAACRVGAATSRFYGDAEALLREYAWYSKSTNDEGVRSGGQLKPNDLGLFDIYGNVLEWTQDPAFLYRWPGGNKEKKDKEYMKDIEDRTSRLLRGGSFGYPSPYVRSANRNPLRPSNVDGTAGFRVARTYD